MRAETFELAGLSWNVAALDVDEQFEVECILASVLAPAVGVALSTTVQGLAAPVVALLQETVEDTGKAKRVVAAVAEDLAKHVPGATIKSHGLALVVSFGEPMSDDMRTLISGVVDGRMDVGVGLVSTTSVRLVLPKDLQEDSEKAFDLSRLLDLDTSDERLQPTWGKLLDAVASTAGDTLRDVLYTLANRIDHSKIRRLFDLVILSRKATVSSRGDTMFVADYKVLSDLLARDPLAKWDLLFRGLLVTYAPTMLVTDAVDTEAVDADTTAEVVDAGTAETVEDG